jgi:hypothetical protein
LGVDYPYMVRVAEGIMANPPGSVDEVLKVIGGLHVLPGFPFLASASGEKHLEFIYDALGRGRIAQGRGVPSIPLFAFMKTGSAFSSAALGEILDVPTGVISVEHVLAFAPWARFAAAFPLALHDHLYPHDANLRTLSEAGVTRCALQVRDPRQVMVSLAHHILKTADASNAHLIEIHRRDGFPALLDAVVDQFLPEYAYWTHYWATGAERFGIQPIWLRLEDMATEPERFFSRLLQAFEAPDFLQRRIAPALAAMDAQRAQGGLNFRAGHSDEWRTAISGAQARRIALLSGGAFQALYDL